MDLHTTYYMDLRKQYNNISEAYDKHYKEHTIKHGDDSVSRQRFTTRICCQGRSVGRAIDTSHKGKPSERKGNKYWAERKNKRGKKPSLSTYRARRKKGMSSDDAFCTTAVKNRSKRHNAPEPKVKLATYYTRRGRGFTHEQAISPVLMRPPINI